TCQGRRWDASPKDASETVGGSMQLKRHFHWSLLPSARMRCLVFTTAVLVLGVGPALAGDALSSEPSSGGPTLPQKNGSTAPTASVEVRLEDESILKLILKDDRLEMMTRFGRLTIPVSEIEKIEFG